MSCTSPSPPATRATHRQDCNNPDVEQLEMSDMLIKKKDLTADLRRLVELMHGEVELIQTDPEKTNGQVIYDETMALVGGLEEMQRKDVLTPDDIKAFCTNMVDVIKHVLDLVMTADKWCIKIATGYIDTVIREMTNSLKMYKEIGALTPAEMTTLVSEAGAFAGFVATFCDSRATVYQDEQKRTTSAPAA